MVHSVSNLYTIDEKGQRTYKIDQLTKEQAEFVAQSCHKEAFSGRFKTVLFAGGLALSLLVTGFVTLAITKLSIALFAGLIANLGLPFGAAVICGITFTAQLVGAGLVCALGLYGAKVALWTPAVAKIIQMWEYSFHLDRQMVDALLRKGYLESLS